MPADVEVNADLGKLESFLKNVYKLHGMYIKVGVLAGPKNKREKGESLTNAQLGVYHEFGSYSKSLPQRSFIQMPLEHERDKIRDVMTEKLVDNLMTGNLKTWLENIGLGAERAIDDAFASGGFGTWTPLKPATIAHKNKGVEGSSSILIDLGFLRGSITSQVVKEK